MKLRNLDPSGDRLALERLIADIEEYDLHPALGERKLFDLVDPCPEAGRSPRGLVAEGQSGIIAYLPLIKEQKQKEQRQEGKDREGREKEGREKEGRDKEREQADLWTTEIVVHPDHRRPEIVEALLREAIEWVPARGGDSIRLWAYIPEVVRAAERAGFRLERELLNMRAPLPATDGPRFSPGIEVRGFREGDESKWLEGNNRVFAGHPENGNWGLADLDRRRRRPWFSSEGLRMAWDGDDLAGFCWTKTPSPRAGEIYAIGVLPEYRGTGLGRALLLEGMDHMHTHEGAAACVLYVDAANLPALRMYRAMGFRPHHTDRSYLMRLGTLA